MKIFAFIAAWMILPAVNADEPWMYPVSVSSPVSLVELNSQTLKIGYVESRGVRISESTSRTVHASVARFEDVIQWYSEKIGGTNLPEKLDAYTKRTPGKVDVHDGTAFDIKSVPTTLITFRFTSGYKQITFLPPVVDGDVVAVTLLGTKDETSIQVVRKHPVPPESQRK
ncbi:MAG: hypothetical protein HKN47_17445 [Pirellulaceae bacterium]|nr:hypothetical protein [Pirellulaceae bacterium]